MKYRLLCITVFLCICLLVSGCDAGLEIIGASIDRYPDRIVYFAGVDDTLDLSGGQITLHLRDGEVKSYQMDDVLVVVEHKVDFNKPGVYTLP